jgi:hypothetical protein
LIRRSVQMKSGDLRCVPASQEAHGRVRAKSFRGGLIFSQRIKCLIYQADRFYPQASDLKHPSAVVIFGQKWPRAWPKMAEPFGRLVPRADWRADQPTPQKLPYRRWPIVPVVRQSRGGNLALNIGDVEIAKNFQAIFIANQCTSRTEDGLIQIKNSALTSSSFREGPIHCDEPRQYGRDQPGWIGSRLSGLPRQHLGGFASV